MTTEAWGWAYLAGAVIFLTVVSWRDRDVGVEDLIRAVVWPLSVWLTLVARVSFRIKHGYWR